MADFPPDARRSLPGSIVAFFVLTFAVTWACFITAARLSRDLAPGAGIGAGARLLILLGTFAPAVVALVLTHRARGSAGVRALLARLFRWRVPAWCYVFAIGTMIAVKLAVAGVVRLATGAWPRFGDLPLPVLLAATVFSTVIGGQTGEEIGWRGYALPRLARHLGLAGASLLLGAIWAVWHLPLFYLRGVDTYGQSFAVYLLQVMAFSVALAWLYWRTGGSLLLTMLMHAAINNTKDIVAPAPRAPANPLLPHATLESWTGAAILGLLAIVLLIRMRGAPRTVGETGESLGAAVLAPPGLEASSR